MCSERANRAPKTGGPEFNPQNLFLPLPPKIEAGWYTLKILVLGEVETEDSVASQPRLLGKFQAREKPHFKTTITKSGRSLKKDI